MADTCVVVGVGPGLGSAIARRFARGGCSIGLVSRSSASSAPVADAVAALGAKVFAAQADVADEAEMGRAFTSIASALGAPSILAYNASGFGVKSFLELTPKDFETNFRASCVGAVIASQAVLPAMLAAGRGTLLFTGATASLRGSARFAPFAAGKFALRALTQSLAREFGPRGVHVAHVIIDGPVESALARSRGATTTLLPDDVAESYYLVHTQPKSAWTQELDLRPFDEKF
jgi:NAD(P)-dependent dehydrogenase (short-subunit alcohol dehydrogenase family)